MVLISLTKHDVYYNYTKMMQCVLCENNRDASAVCGKG